MPCTELTPLPLQLFYVRGFQYVVREIKVILLILNDTAFDNLWKYPTKPDDVSEYFSFNILISIKCFFQ